ncbi:small T antigen [Chaerephon polyomavirus 1]|uniref:small T antigen n=1 Tax=Chaerephon polyomavirus 1 TaxID=1276181 RepID=UPI0002A71BEC|nr:small T antigen [Chaerephon polyomavirus 1]AGA82577.1 small T antigen [Chaerephon polyomavirus 1]
MDRILEKSEKETLLQLLELNSQCFCNFPIMRTAYKRASKKLHPDKGGSTQQMMLLNSLWQKYQEGIIDLRNTQVCAATMDDLNDVTLGEAYGCKFKDVMLKTPQCLVRGPNNCKCITSILYNQHILLKKLCLKPCLLWGECYCLFCFGLWYGLPLNWSTFEVWIAILEEVPKALLQLEDLSKYHFI